LENFNSAFLTLLSMPNDYKAVQRQTAQYDLFNRLHSISSDSAFVRATAEAYKHRFEVIPNQRCGTWYCDPSSSSSVYAYFKSTDGHTGNWGFNMRRSNLPFAEMAEKKGGVILVDSTRRGKRMPDALSKTVPIWCAVINRAIARRRRGGKEKEWDGELYTPPNVVSGSERAQIEEKLDGWAEALEVSLIETSTAKADI
jgi:tRNA A64-2'-O-ribosylphosphate transferase